MIFTKSQLKTQLITVLMLATALAAWTMKPRALMSDQRAKVKLEELIPTNFGDWKDVPQSGRQVVNPQQAAMLEELYSETLSRVYVNAKGSAVMLSLAYGANQSRDLQIHRPEVCYSAQGFQLLNSAKTNLLTVAGIVPAMQLVAKQSQRIEPITYWVRIGEKVVRGNLEQGFARVGYGLRGVVADGILFRVSSISTDTKDAYVTQKQFIDDLLRAVPASTKNYLLGKGTS